MPIVSRIEFNEEVVKGLEVIYGTRDVLRRRRLVREALAARPGERILDVGCGPGFYAAELLDEVGAEGSVVGVDSSADMLAVAAHRCEGRGSAEFHEADATSLPVEDGGFDAALSVQVLEYVDDVDAALREIHRALRPGGRVVLWDVDWTTLSLHTTDQDRTDRVLRAWDQHLAHPALPRTLAARMRAAGFEGVSAEGHTFATTELTPEAYGGSLVGFVEGYVVGNELLDAEVVHGWGDEQRALGERGEFYFTVIQLCFAGTRSG
jgi:ubiquinone/menaquinone biosynthesis C-methylase UbiE